jgi:Zn-dependent protease
LEDHSRFIATLLIWAVPTIFAIITHEVMHGVIARAFGDDTAERMGRLTLNPVPHIDPVGTILLPGILIFMHLPVFGYAKPVPVNFQRLQPPRPGMIAVAAAGPLTNFALAAISAILLRWLIHSPGASSMSLTPAGVVMLAASVKVNVMLAVFNLLPLLPLDGGRVVVGLLPRPLAMGYARLERYGFVILFLLLYIGWIDPLIDLVTRTIAGALLS